VPRRRLSASRSDGCQVIINMFCNSYSSNKWLTFFSFNGAQCRQWDPEPSPGRADLRVPGRASDVEHAELGEGGRRPHPAEATEAAVLEAAALVCPVAPRHRAMSSGDCVTDGIVTQNAATLSVSFAM
jgi:hypothetical protein